MKHCAFCESESPDSAQFCGSCGQLLNAAVGRSVADLSTGPLPASDEQEQEELNALFDIAVPLILSGNEQIPPGNVPIVHGIPAGGAAMVHGIPAGGAPMVQGTPSVHNNPPNVQIPPQGAVHSASPSSTSIQPFPHSVSQVSSPSPMSSQHPETLVSHLHHSPTEAHTHRHIRKHTSTHMHPHMHTYTHTHLHTHEEPQSKQQQHPHEKHEDQQHLHKKHEGKQQHPHKKHEGRRQHSTLLSNLALLVDLARDELLAGGVPALSLALFPASARSIVGTEPRGKVWGVHKFSFTLWGRRAGSVIKKSQSGGDALSVGGTPSNSGASAAQETLVSHVHTSSAEMHTHRHIGRHVGAHAHAHTHTYTHTHSHAYEKRRSKQQQHSDEKLFVESVLMAQETLSTSGRTDPYSGTGIGSSTSGSGTGSGTGTVSSGTGTGSGSSMTSSGTGTGGGTGMSSGTAMGSSGSGTGSGTGTVSSGTGTVSGSGMTSGTGAGSGFGMGSSGTGAGSGAGMGSGTGAGSGASAGSGAGIAASGISLPLIGSFAWLSALIGAFIVVSLIVGSVTVWGFTNHFHRVVPSSSPKPTPTPIVPASSAAVSIVPMSTTQQGNYTITAITGNPSGAKRQVFAHTVMATTAPVSETVNATGQGQTQGAQATGVLTITNSDPTYTITFDVGTQFTNDNNGGQIIMVLDQAVSVGPAPNGGFTVATANAHVLEYGTIGNIPSQSTGSGFDYYCDPSVSNCAPFQGYLGPYEVYNTAAFTGGADPQSYTFVQQSDIDNATNALISANQPNGQQVLQGQLKSNERLIGTPQCNSNTSANQVAGAQVSQVTVTVSFTCSGEAYDYQGALALAQNVLKQHVKQFYPTFVLLGNITTVMQTATVTDASNGTVTLTIQASGTWAAQFDTSLEQALAQSIAGKTESQAQAILNAQPTVEVATIQLHGGNSDLLPANPAQITITIQKT